MSQDVLVSCHEQDRDRVVHLVEALKKAGFALHWDKATTGGDDAQEAWRKKCEVARCLIVVWSRDNNDSNGALEVLEAAALADARNVLVQVVLDRVTPPLQFQKQHFLRLGFERGAPRERDIDDIVGAIRARLDNQPQPKPKSFYQRSIAGPVLSFAAIATLTLSFLADVFSFQNNFCSFEPMQPFLSDFCGKHGFGDKPTKAERLAWNKAIYILSSAYKDGDDLASQPIRKGEDLCKELDAFAHDFPNARQAKTAQNIVATAPYIVSRDTEVVRQLPLAGVITGGGEPTQKAAKNKALKDATEEAGELCKLASQDPDFEFIRSELSTHENGDYSCQVFGDMHFCRLPRVEAKCFFHPLVKSCKSPVSAERADS